MQEIGDTDLRDELVSAVAEAAAGDEWSGIVSVAGALRKRGSGPDDPLNALVAALEYHLVLDPDSQRGYGPFGPMIESGGTVYPAPLEHIDAEVFPLWARALAFSPRPLVTARFADLLWEARYGDAPYAWAQQAVDAYVAAAEDDFGHVVEVSEALQRAFEIAARINDRTRKDATISALVSFAGRSLDSSQRSPGVVLPILALLAGRRQEERPPELDELIDDAIRVYGDDAWLLEAALDIRARLTEPGDREPLHVAQVEAFAELGRRSEGILKYAHLQHAIELAEQHGLRDLGDAIRKEVEALSPEDLALTTISAEVEIPREKIEQFIEQIVGDDTLEHALSRFGSHIPTGLPQENREFVTQLMAEHPFQYLATSIVIGPENSLVRSTQDEHDRAEQALIEHELRRLGFFGIFAVDILGRIRERYGSLTAAQTWFECDLIEPVVADRIARAIELYEANDSDTSASVLAPRIERIVRSMARAVGLTVTRSPDPRGRPGGVKGLGEILSDLEGRLDDATRRYLRNLLAEITGMNVRNRVGHGLLDLATPEEAALLIHAACHLRLLGPAKTTDEQPTH